MSPCNKENRKYGEPDDQIDQALTGNFSPKLANRKRDTNEIEKKARYREASENREAT